MVQLEGVGVQAGVGEVLIGAPEFWGEVAQVALDCLLGA